MSLKHAQTYKKYGFSIIPTDDHKRPAVSSWKPYQYEIAKDTDLQAMFSNPKAKGLAVICGAVSGNLEVIDVDCKYDLTGSLFEDYMQTVMDENPALAEKLLVAQTVNKGYHIYYRCSSIQGNQKLANRDSSKEELEDNPHDKVKVLIETRGEAGYVIAAPTAGYVFLGKKAPKDCPVITPEERDILIEVARSMNQYHEKPVTHTVHESKSFALSPFDDYNNRGDLTGLLQKHGWTVVKETSDKIVFKRPGNTSSKTSGDFNRKLGWFSVFTTSSQFEPNKAYKPYAVYAILECNGDFHLAAKKLLDDGYGTVRKRLDRKVEKAIRTAKIEGKLDVEIVKAIHEGGHNLTVEAAQSALADFYTNCGASISSFWEVECTPKGGRKIHIIRTKLEKFLTEEGGFYLYFYDPTSNIFKIIKNDNGLIEEASTEQVKKFVKNYILGLPGAFDDITREDLLEAVYKGGNTYFADSFFEFLEPAQIDFLRDTADIAYFPFKNGVICVDKDGYELKSYGELKKSIWKSQVIDFHIDPIEIENPEDVEFYQFIKHINSSDPERIKYCIALIGYLLHKFKDPTKPYMIILGEETEDEKKGGGTGKGIFVTGVSKLINTEQIDGKNFKIDKNFALQRIKLDTKLVIIQDVRKNFDVESWYSVITEGMTIEKKNKDELYIPYTDSPKLGVTTNYSISAISNHAKRRLRLLEFSGFFRPEYTPADYFKHRLFDDWDFSQWGMFYNFMFSCVQHFLKHGISNIDSSHSIKRKQIRLQYSDEFFSFFEEYAGNGCANWKLFKELYDQFLGENDMEKKDYSQKRFKKAMEDAANIFEYHIQDRKNRQAGNKVEIMMTKTEVQSGEQSVTQ